jgi:hypothetical protein
MESTIDESWIPFEAIVATSHRVEKYGGVAVPDELLMQFAEEINAGRIPMIGHHDWTKPIRTKDIEATLVTLDDGERGVRLTGLVDRADWAAVGQIGGMSFSATEPIGRADGPNPEAPALKLSADAGWFDDQTIGEACSIMSVLAPVDGARLLQFTAVDDARLVLEMGYNLVVTLGPGLATNALWDGIKYLLLHRKNRTGDAAISPTRIELQTDLASGEVIGIIDTSDPAVASEALATYAAAVTKAAEVASYGRQVVVWSEGESGGRWVSSPTT